MRHRHCDEKKGGTEVKRKAFRFAGALLAAAIVSAACGGDSEPSEAQQDAEAAPGVEEAQEIVAEAEKPVSERPPGPPFDASVVRGKKVWFVSFALAIDYSQQIEQGVQQGAEALGVSLESFDGKFSPAEVTRGINVAIQDKADAIIVHSLPPSVVAPALKNADDAGIELIAAEIQNPGPPLPDTPETIDAIAGHSYSIPTEQMAAKVVADSGGDANVQFFSASDIGPGSKQGTDSFVARMKELCPECPVEVIDAPVAQWDGLTQRIASLLRANPDVNYVVPIFDGMAVNMVPGIRSAGADDRVKIVSGDATASVLENISRGEVVIGDVGQPNVWTGVAIMDQTARVLAGEEPLEDVGIPYRMFTENNVDGLELGGDPTLWYGDVDFLSEYKRIWGVE
jgi:ribose transport system substrate-binding protein